MSELKPCPFCGGEAKAYVRDYGDTHYWRVSCSSDKCGVNPVTNVYHTEAGAIAAWNTRAPMSYEDLKILLDELGVSERTCHPVIAITDDGGYEYALCSECDGRIEPEDNYCPNCGARVIGGNE